MANMPQIVSKAEWLIARKELLLKEKEVTRARDVLNAQRRALPMMKVDKDYVFETTNEKATMLDLFEGRHQLIIYHFMFHRDRGEGCPGCSYLIDNLGHLAHLHARDTTVAMMSRAPAVELEIFKKRMGWHLPWYSS